MHSGSIELDPKRWYNSSRASGMDMRANRRSEPSRTEHLMMFHLVRPYVSGPDRFSKATVVKSFATAVEAFAELTRIADQLSGYGIAGDALELVVVDDERRPVKRGDAS